MQRQPMQREPKRGALIVGAGMSGFLHALALRAAAVKIDGVFDPRRAQAELLASLVGGHATSSFAVAERMAVDVVAVCSPPTVHVAQAEALAGPERLLFVEKPVALDVGGLERLAKLPNVVPVLQWRAGRAARELATLLRVEAFGLAPRIEISIRTWRDAAYFADGKRGRAQWGCGAMTSIGIHAIDLATYVVGRPILTWSGHETFGRADLDVTTRGCVTMMFEGGAVADVSITVDDERTNEVRITARGPMGYAELVATEADPTAAPLSVRGNPRRVASALRPPDGSCGVPLLVPFVKEALVAHARGLTSVSVRDVAAAHAVAAGLAGSTEIVRRAG